jgi:hypothetical protein
VSGARARGVTLFSPLPPLAAVMIVSAWWLACGADVDLGGTMDAASSAEGGASNPQAPDAGADCDPCSTSGDCRSTSACVSIDSDSDEVDGGNTYCAYVCAGDDACRSDQTCRYQASFDGGRLRVCVPKTGVCPSASGPAGADGGPLERCGNLTGPNIFSKCKGCGYDCQPNGCYGGWWCNTTTVDCERPPEVCPD